MIRRWIRLRSDVINAHGGFAPGDEVCWPAPDCAALIDSGAAEEIAGPTQPEPEVDAVFSDPVEE